MSANRGLDSLEAEKLVRRLDSQLRVVHLGIGIIPVPPGDRSAGREEYIYQLTRHLARLSCRVAVIDIPTDSRGRAKREQSAVVYHDVWLPNLPAGYARRFLRRYVHYVLFTLKTYVFAVSAGVQLFRLMGTEHVDVIHTHDRGVALGAVATNWLRARSALVIYTPQGAYGLNRFPWYRKYLVDIAETLALRTVHHLIALTDVYKDWLVREFDVPPSKVTQIFVGTALDEFERHQQKRSLALHQSSIVLSVGAISPRKNQLTAVRVIAEVVATRPGVRLILAGTIGDSGYLETIKRFVEDHGLADVVEFRGEVSRADLYDLYCDAAVFLLPTTAEVQPTVLMEALAFGLPVVTSNIGSIVDVVGDSGAALLFDQYDVKGMAEAIVRLIGHSSLRALMSQRAKQAAAAFSYDCIAERTLRLYEELVSKREFAPFAREKGRR